MSSRLGKISDAYGPRDVIETPNAFVGIWQSCHRYVKTSDAGSRSTVRATILDHACVAGSEDEFETVLRNGAARCAVEQIDELALFVADGSAAAAVARRLPHRQEPYLLTLDLEEPKNSAERGLYVDPIWF